MNCLYILEINPLSVISSAIISSHSGGCLFTFQLSMFETRLRWPVMPAGSWPATNLNLRALRSEGVRFRAPRGLGCVAWPWEGPPAETCPLGGPDSKSQPLPRDRLKSQNNPRKGERRTWSKGVEKPVGAGVVLREANGNRATDLRDLIHRSHTDCPLLKELMHNNIYTTPQRACPLLWLMDFCVLSSGSGINKPEKQSSKQAGRSWKKPQANSQEVCGFSIPLISL